MGNTESQQMLKQNMRGVFCLETIWFDTDDGTSVRPALEMLKASYLKTNFIHRNAVTKDEFFFHIGKWVELEASEYPVLYLGYHGKDGNIYLVNDDKKYDDENRIELDQFSQRLKGKCKNRIIHFSSCSTLNILRKNAQNFLRETGAYAVSGYKKEVEWMQSTAFDILFLDLIQYGGSKNITPRFMTNLRKCLMKEPYSELRKNLGFELVVRQ